MPRRKKHTRLPNGYGSIRFLGKNRRNPYAVHPPGDIDGNRPAAICYVDDWMKGFIVLTALKAGTYKEGMEKEISIRDKTSDLDALAQSILADYNRSKGTEATKGKTFAEVYEDFYKWKYEQPKKSNSKAYSEATKRVTQAAFKNCAVLHDREFASLRHGDLQAVVDNCPLKHASLELIVSLFKQMYAYADLFELCDKDYSTHVKINVEDDDEHGVPFSDEELAVLWEHKDNPTVEMILIMCYSGYRISAYQKMKVDLDEWYFQGGVKTAAGKNRIVPIHSAIQPLVFARISRFGRLMEYKPETFRKSMYEAISALGIPSHTPHDCRHTFSRLCEQYKVNENDRKRMMGHSFGQDITNGIYGHRTLEDLRLEIEKIQVSDL